MTSGGRVFRTVAKLLFAVDARDVSASIQEHLIIRVIACRVRMLCYTCGCNTRCYGGNSTAYLRKHPWPLTLKWMGDLVKYSKVVRFSASNPHYLDGQFDT